MRRGMTVAISALVLLLVCSAGWGKEIHKTFDGIKAVELGTASGDCVVQTHASSEVIVDLVYDDKLEGTFEYEIKKSGSTLVIKEEWKRGSHSGKVVWTLTVPADTEMEFGTASGDITVSGLTKSIEAATASGDIDARDMKGDIEIATASGDAKLVNLEGDVEIATASGDIHVEKARGELELSTASGEITAIGLSDGIELNAASGDIDISDSRGDFDVSAASGDINLTNVEGTFDVSCASGDITAEGVKIGGASEFSVASGDVEIVLAKTCEFDLEVNSASGDVTLDYNGNPVKGMFVFTIRKDKGRIVCPFKFDKEEEFEQNGKKHLRKTFSKDGDTPVVKVNSASGTVELKK
jgi:DUF4097 and DUF4098 domain-containing protein YvlB